jgi:hypothetical protein
MQLILLCRSRDLKFFGLRAVIQPLLDDLNTLASAILALTIEGHSGTEELKPHTTPSIRLLGIAKITNAMVGTSVFVLDLGPCLKMSSRTNFQVLGLEGSGLELVVTHTALFPPAHCLVHANFRRQLHS